jgi:hypothetical protein
MNGCLGLVKKAFFEMACTKHWPVHGLGSDAPARALFILPSRDGPDGWMLAFIYYMTSLHTDLRIMANVTYGHRLVQESFACCMSTS